AFLREAGLVEHARTLALQVCGHAEQGADGDHAGAADAGDQDVPRLFQAGLRPWRRQVGEQLLDVGHRVRLLQLAAVHGDEAGAEAVDAAVVLFAAVLVDFALSAELGFLRHHRHAVRLHRAVAAAFAAQRIDEHAFLRVDRLAALAAA